ncbi:peroxin 26 [Fusarium tjaetaba]|uniref:Peroxin 26 n=1 Tax=Fusarium tjaetaba TaxID=1567544 RepID=A0A8H5RAK6_9HYPO|nr:peroxin 26 [Fusarium tjaetaba]KAF5629092.1 peroxin 26 [Fusarium tjaetaba]
MSFNNHAAYSPTAMSSSTGPSGLPNSLLSTSISSLASSTSSRHPSQISKTYRQASTLFLTRRLPEALTTLLPLITPPEHVDDGEPAPVARASRTTRIKVWSLYLTILNGIVELEPEEGKDAFGNQEWRALCTKVREGEIWDEVVTNGYHGVEGDVDSDVVINLATILLAHARDQKLNQHKLEAYLAASNTPNLDVAGRLAESTSSPMSNRYRSPAKGASGANTPRDLNARVKILELYTLHVLLRNNEWDYAREFISVSSVLDEERREAFLQALQSLHDEQQEQERLENEERQRQENELKREIEEAKKLRAENEEKERKRIEEERMKREGSEVDYGIDDTASHAGSTRPRKARAPSSSSSRQSRPRGTNQAGPKANGKAVSQAPTLTSRASMVITQLRTIIEHLGSSLNSNPMFLFKFLAFVMGLILMLSNTNIRERVKRMIAVFWSKVKGTAGMGVKVYNLRASVAILFKACTFETVERVRDAFTTAHNALILIVAETTFVTDAHERRGPNVGVANWAFAIALVTETTDGDTGLFAAHNKIAARQLRALDDTKADHEQHNDTLSEYAPKKDSMKRKASINAGELSPKRTKHDEYFREAPSEPRKRNSSTNRHNSYGDSPDIDIDRRKNATQEEKRRGKRLFGGLLSTLSQTSGSVQQKRRLEIERRQQDRLQKQNIEEDRLREEKRLRLTEIRRGQQLTFDEEVMHSKHAKMLAMAPYLRTKSRPHILTAEQEDTIDDQIRQTKVTIEHEVGSLNARKGRQAKGGRQPLETTAPSREDLDHDSADTNEPEKSPHGQEKPVQASNHDHHHDESVDVLEEAEEDVVIY